MKLKLFLMLSVVTGLELIARGPKVLTDKERKELEGQRKKSKEACEAEQKGKQWSGGAFDDCMKRKGWN